MTAHQAASSAATSTSGRHRAEAVRRAETAGEKIRRWGAGPESGDPEGRTPAEAVTAMDES
ncbi:hypothetical protein MMAGJ_56240 [Mycolicibacterium mageritense]|uniref:Uncharacterized protein n=1 Tax=Mycolicibacterium mageritense TaxID=53462 RepID=A0ABM7I0G3_MYCME|nr:hypothetical protein MMAGJ_56240 [Mycolicibacterium mageritense]